MKFLKNAFLLGSVLIGSIVPAHAEPKPSDRSAHEFSFTSINGSPLPLTKYKGQVLLVVNTASKCGFTPQYAKLQMLYESYKDKGLVILGVPSNDFGGQEPGTPKEIQEFCQINYGVTFPLTSKNNVVGPQAHPFYKWAADVLGAGAAPKWNFHKYLVDKEGNLVTYYGSRTPPDSIKMRDEIERLLAKR